MKVSVSALRALCLVMLSWPVAGESLRSHYLQARCKQFASVQGDEMRQARQVFRSALQAGKLDSPELDAAWRALGFEWLRTTHADGSYWIARESGSRCRGRGFYAFSSDRRRQTVLQVPHRFMDRYTGTIALELATSGKFRALAWNTVPRRVKSGEGIQDADLAHRWDSYFVAFTEAFAAVLPRGRLLQLHGFAAGKRETPEAVGANIIVSAGQRWPTAGAMAVSACLDAAFPESVRLFPRDISELGATRNIQGRLLRGFGHSGFVHVELSDALRDVLGDHSRSAQRLGYCLTERVP